MCWFNAKLSKTRCISVGYLRNDIHFRTKHMPSCEWRRREISNSLMSLIMHACWQNPLMIRKNLKILCWPFATAWPFFTKNNIMIMRKNDDDDKKITFGRKNTVMNTSNFGLCLAQLNRSLWKMCCFFSFVPVNELTLFY